MNYRLMLAWLYLPGSMKREQLLELYRRTARALGSDPGAAGYEGVSGRSDQQILEAFAEMTRDQVQLAMAKAGEADLEVLSDRLRREAEEVGRQLREKMHLRTQRDFRIALRIIYQTLDIDLHVSVAGEVSIRHCFFSKYYSARICRFMSALDDGLAQGLSGGHRLHFVERLTEGFPCCRAMITKVRKGTRGN